MRLLGKLRILYICGRAPCPATYGAQLRILNIGRLLQKQGAVRLVVVPRKKPDKQQIEQTKAVFGDFNCLLAEIKSNPGFRYKIRRMIDRRWVQGRDDAISVRDRDYLA